MPVTFRKRIFTCKLVCTEEVRGSRNVSRIQIRTFIVELVYAPVAQLDRALRFGRKGQGFESLPVYHAQAPHFVGFLRGLTQAIRIVDPSKRVGVRKSSGLSETNLLFKTCFERCSSGLARGESNPSACTT